ncbi:MAG: acyl-[ACP]--phospholipid O-acyltransferase [Hyphomicrobium sp.]|nr:acyl-[ACP]--phospholipid O-acyltransferase [Hyphomicrobium sp.]
MFQTLMTTRRFAPLFWCQLLSALNDNFVKNALVILILFKLGEAEGATLVTLAGAVLVLPFLVLSGIGGEWADKLDKGTLAERLKRFEIPVGVLAAAGFVLNSIPILFAALAGYGIIAALFGPIKYGVLPEQLEKHEISAGNAFVESGTFAAILIGTIGGGLLVTPNGTDWHLPVVVVAMSVLCWVSAYFMPRRAEAAAPGLAIDLNPWTSTLTLMRDLTVDRKLWQGGLITSWFWLVGAVALSLLPVLMKNVVGGDQTVITAGLVVFVVGIAVGSALAARASRRRPNMALVPCGAFLMAVACFALAWATAAVTKAPAPIGAAEFMTTLTGWNLMAGLFLLSLAGGLFIVPSFAAVQLWAPDDKKARIVAACNVLSAAFITSASLGLAALQYAGFSVATLFLMLGALNVVALALVLAAWGKEGIKDLGFFLFRTFLDLEVEGVENLPEPGTRAIIAPNHVSLIDAPLLHAIMPSHAHYAVDTGMANTWWVRPFLKLVTAYAIDPTKPMSMRHLIADVKAGKTLVIFPEGRLTTTGGLMKVYDGTAMIADKADAVVVPVRIEGPERSFWGYLTRMQARKALFPKTKVTILPPVKLPVTGELRGKVRRQAAGMALQDIMTDAAVRTARLDQTVFEALVAARQTRDLGRPIVEDPLGTKLTYGRLILGAQVLGRKLAPLAREGEALGVLLPNTAGVAVVFFALQSIGRVAAMLNYSAGAQNMSLACTAAGVKVIVTSRAFVEKARLTDAIAKLQETARIVYLEDVKAEIGTLDKLGGMLQGAKPQSKRKPEEPAAILFTSGSEGTPKGVVLSHQNLLANAFQCLNSIAVDGSDKVFNVMPVFHSFGLTGGLVMPLVGGVPVYLYPSPLHYRIVPELVYQTNATIMFGTDTFLTGYARSAHPYDFHRLRLIVAGAEAVKDRTRQLYMEKFGVRILEGYGVTETAPVLAINTLLANRSGTVGRLVPLMEARLDPVPGIEEGGRLFVRGPNVMLGYMRAEKPGVIDPPHDGWHDTGDIVAIDAQGFIRIKGRAKRFAKIGGEMVSLSAVEAMAAELWPALMTVVVAVPDARKGERLVLISTSPVSTRESFQRFAKAKGVSELSVPGEILIVEKIPLLGSGKPDYVAVAALVKETLQKRPAKPAVLDEEPPLPAPKAAAE